MNWIDANARFSQEHERLFADGEIIFPEGDEGRELYLIQEGAVEIFKETPVGRLRLALFQKGAFFGEMALLQSIPRYAGAKAVGTTRLLILQPGGFLLKIRRDPTLAFEMLQQLSHRIKGTNDRLLDFLKRTNMPLEQIQEILNEYDGVKK